jgi:transcription elongation GreA/GreB family factor
VNKPALRDQIVARLQSELATQTAAAHLARDEAISEESKPENKYDTHSIEASYLAEGQARLAGEIQDSIAFYQSLPLPEFRPTDAIAIGAIVETESNGRTARYFVGPRAGGLEISSAGHTVLVLTPQSPLGRLLLGRRAGDTISLPGRGAAVRHRIARVE